MGSAGTNAERQWHHPGVRALLRGHPPGTDPFQLIRALARAAVAEALAKNWDGPPFCMETLASLRDHHVELVDDANLLRDGWRVPGMIYLRRSAPESRRRYSIAHELIHEFVPDGDGVECESDLPEDVADRAHREKENLCQVGAAELLMPYAPFVTALGVAPHSLARVMELADAFLVSPEAATRRTVDVCGYPSAMLLARPFASLDQEERRRLAVRSPGCDVRDDDLVVTTFRGSEPVAPVRIHRGYIVPRRSVIRRSWGEATAYPNRDRKVFWRREHWPGAGTDRQVLVEAITLPRRPPPIEVLALISAEADPAGFAS